MRPIPMSGRSFSCSFRSAAVSGQTPGARPRGSCASRPWPVTFYPATAERLTAALQAFLQDAVPPRPERPIAILVPHAGYIYSGQIAADAFRQAAQHRYDTVVILGTNHTDPDFAKIAIYPGAAFRTPLGTCRSTRA